MLVGGKCEPEGSQGVPVEPESGPIEDIPDVPDEGEGDQDEGQDQDQGEVDDSDQDQGEDGSNGNGEDIPNVPFG